MKRFGFIVAAVALSAVAAFAQDSQPDRYIQLVERSDSALRVHDFNLANSLITEAMSLQPDNPGNGMLLYNLGVVKSYLGDKEGALRALDAAHAQMPTSVKVLMSRARVKMTNGQRDEAIKDYEQVMQLDSTLTEPYFYRGLAALFSGDIVQTDRDFAMLKRLEPDGELTVHAQAITYAATGQPKEAAECYKRLVSSVPTREYYSGLVENLVASDQVNEAAETIAKAMELYPNDGELYLWRAALNRKRYRNDDAKADAARAIELGVNPDEVKSILSAF